MLHCDSYVCPNTGLTVIPIRAIRDTDQSAEPVGPPAATRTPVATAPTRPAAGAAAPLSTNPAPTTEARRDPVPTNAQICQNWEARVKAGMDAGKSRKEAVRSIAVGDPDFHAQYLKAYNALTVEERRRLR